MRRRLKPQTAGTDLDTQNRELRAAVTTLFALYLLEAGEAEIVACDERVGTLAQTLLVHAEEIERKSVWAPHRRGRRQRRTPPTADIDK